MGILGQSQQLQEGQWGIYFSVGAPPADIGLRTQVAVGGCHRGHARRMAGLDIAFVVAYVKALLWR